VNELVIAIMLVIPSPYKMVNWTVNQVPTQIQLIHKSGLEVSYNASPVSCSFRPRNNREMVFKSSETTCYAVYDLSSPTFIRHPDHWHPVEPQKSLKMNVGD